jgi:hypothetical protein
MIKVLNALNQRGNPSHPYMMLIKMSNLIIPQTIDSQNFVIPHS